MVDGVAAASLNADALSAGIDRVALDAAIRAQGAAFREALSVGHDHLFSGVPLFITPAQLQQMCDVISAVEKVVMLPGWQDDFNGGMYSANVFFYGHDFHLNEQGVHLIEINSNAGGAFLNALLIDSQREAGLYGASPVHASTAPARSTPVGSPPQSGDPSAGSARTGMTLEQEFLEMFRSEWRLERGDAPLRTVAIVDEQPESQYLYPEFLLAKQMFERAGIAAHIADPSALQAREDGLCCDGQRVDLVYNRLTDFDLQRFPHIRSVWERRQVALTPNPAHYRRYADKRKLALLSDADWLRSAGVSQADMDALLQGVPQTKIVRAEDAEQWWAERKQWFFKPASGYGSKGAYRGDKLTRRVFGEIMRSDYVAQRLALPGERKVFIEGAEPQSLKYDVRCYVYNGRIQLIAARLYQGQTTNFRTPGGGFAVVRMAG